MNDSVSVASSAPDATAEVAGFSVSPAGWLEAAFSRVARNQMCELPFYRAGIQVQACGFTLFEQQWVGCLLTPWTLSLLVLPGPGQIWRPQMPGERLALQLPCGNVTFLSGEIADDSGNARQYLSCSLMSPLDSSLTPAQAVTLAQQSARMALSLPVLNTDHPTDLSRRELFRRRSE
ncbi:hydrogenase-2 assembly chaperone [Pantoea sp. B65]|uniref:hydrogenase-2 assembly chaperone n=1 Tax=Pantoea sp. B65 TaxID=2813359 RepID=UPI0039B546AD